MKKVILPILFITSVSANAQLGGLINKAKNKEKKEEKETRVTGKGDSNKSKADVTSPSHEKYMNKVVFASKNLSLNKGQEIESDFGTEFNIDDLIYFRVYLDNTLTNYLSPLVKESNDVISKNSTFRLDFYIDNVLVEDLTSSNIPLNTFTPEEKATWTTFKGAFKSEYEKEDMVGKNVFKELIRKQESKLTPGKHQLKMEVSPIYIDPVDPTKNSKGSVIATGNITIIAKEVIIDPYDPIVCIPKSNMNDAALETKIANYYLKKFKTTSDVVRTQSSDWAIEKNKYTGLIVRRKIDVYIGYKSAEGVCYKVLKGVSQEYLGGKYNDDLIFEEYTRYLPVEVNCKCLQKK